MKMARHRLSSKRPPPEIGLHMECIEEELEPSQIMYYTKADKEYTEIQNKLDNYIKKFNAEVVEKSENCLVLQLNTMPPSSSLSSQGQISSGATGGKNARQSVQANQNYQQMVGQGMLTRSSANSAGNTYLVMDSGLSFVMGQMQSSNITPEQSSTQTISKSVSGTRSRQSGSVMVTTRGKIGSKKQTLNSVDSDVLTPPSTRTRDKAKNQSLIQQQTPSQNSSQVAQEQQVYSTGNILSTSGNYRIKVNAKQIPPPSKPTENNAVGGLSAGSKTSWKSTSDDVTVSKGSADSREVTFNKVTGKTFPSLVVVARPHLKAKYISQSKVTQERTALDAKVKGVLMYTTTKFTEWLIQQGLIRSEQICQTHLNNDLSPVKLKLGMYSDVSKFPYSGGYVWISDCCPSQFVSVFSGSIFEGAPHPPTTLLKLIYHWACQTNVQNIVQWVKVDNLYVKNFFANMRAVCTQAVHEKYKKMGGPRKKIEVGVISLGTTSQDGNKRQVKVEVLGVMDYENKLIRLRAVEPHSDERSFKRRFVRILQPLEEWVSKDSTILTDFTVNKAALNSMGFHTVFQVTSDVKYSNQNVMEYLRRIVPRMFQNTLSLLSRQIIQQFLDELVWREVWGPIPSQAFVSIIAHMAEQTKLEVAENFLVRLGRVAANPFKQWNYSTWISTAGNKSNSKTQQKSPVTPLTSPETVATAPVEFTSNPGKSTRARKRAAEQSFVAEVTVSPVPPKKMAKVGPKEKVKKEEKGGKVAEKKKEKESGEKLSEEIIKFIEGEKQIPLETYYYGCRKGSDPSESSSSAPFNVKCCVCFKRFSENIVFLKHIILHCQTEPELKVNLKKVHQCENCFLGFNASTDLKTHLEEVHFLINGKPDCDYLCQICEKKFDCRYDLVFHMQKTHVEMEMPYECGVCNFRTSLYRLFVEHFVQAHKGEEHVFCPYCLKVVKLSHRGAPIGSNVQFYLSHLEKHQRLSLTKDCNACQLSFIHRGILDQHLEADHGSWKNTVGTESLQEIYTGLLMPEPGGLIKPSPVAKPGKSPKTKNLFAFNKFKALEVRGLDENSTCIECEEFLLDSEHFTGSYNCLKCQYATSCEKAMNEHVAIFHEMVPPQFNVGKPTVLGEEMLCGCGYSSCSGNRIAKHLALCERKSATAAVRSSQSPKENALESPKGEGQNVLNMLGLVRKSPEIGSAEEESMKENVAEDDEININAEVEMIKMNVEEEPTKENVEEKPKKENMEEEPTKENLEEEPTKENVEEEPTKENVEEEPTKENVEEEPTKENVAEELTKENVTEELTKQNVEEEQLKENEKEEPTKENLEEEPTKESVAEETMKDNTAVEDVMKMNVEKEPRKNNVEEEVMMQMNVQEEPMKDNVAEEDAMNMNVQEEPMKDNVSDEDAMKMNVEEEPTKDNVAEENLMKMNVEEEPRKDNVEYEDDMQMNFQEEPMKDNMEEDDMMQMNVEDEPMKDSVEEDDMMKMNVEEEPMKGSVEEEAMKEDAEMDNVMKMNVEEPMEDEVMKMNVDNLEEEDMMKMNIEEEPRKDNVEEEDEMKMNIEEEPMKENVAEEVMKMNVEEEPMKDSVREEVLKENVEKEMMAEDVEKELMKENTEEDISTCTGRKPSEEYNNVRVEGQKENVDVSQTSDSFSLENENDGNKCVDELPPKIESNTPENNKQEAPSEIPARVINQKKVEDESPEKLQIETEEKEVGINKGETEIPAEKSETKNDSEFEGNVKGDIEAVVTNQEMEIDRGSTVETSGDQETDRNNENEDEESVANRPAEEANNEESDSNAGENKESSDLAPPESEEKQTNR